MSNEEIVRAWRDAAYRQRLSEEEQALLPGHPAGAIELTDEELGQVAGGESWSACATISCLSCGGPDCNPPELA